MNKCSAETFVYFLPPLGSLCPRVHFKACKICQSITVLARFYPWRFAARVACSEKGSMRVTGGAMGGVDEAAVP